MLPSPLASSAAIIPSARNESPGQPSPTMDAPAIPSSPYPFTSSTGKRAASQKSAAIGTTFVSTHTPHPVPDLTLPIGQQLIQAVKIGGP